MTNQASTFALAASQLKKTHLMCLHHFRTAMFSAHSGMSQDVRSEFLQKCYKLIFQVDGIAEFPERFEKVRNEFRKYPDAHKLKPYGITEKWFAPHLQQLILLRDMYPRNELSL